MMFAELNSIVTLDERYLVLFIPHIVVVVFNFFDY